MPVSTGAIEAAAGRTAAVTPAARARSCGGTSESVYAWRVGTSICESADRSRSTAAASGNVGMNGSTHSSTLDGRWVNTIVLSSPIRAATCAASRYDAAASRFAPNSSGPIVVRADAEAHREPVRDERLDDEAAGERIQREQRCEPLDDPERRHVALRRCGDAATRSPFKLNATAATTAPAGAVQQQHAAIRQHGRGERAEGDRRRADDVVDRKAARHAGGVLGERRPARSPRTGRRPDRPGSPRRAGTRTRSRARRRPSAPRRRSSRHRPRRTSLASRTRERAGR